ncbi:MAG: M50 family metallopeptidase [Oscillospiraceae bacterium]|nr:M50 family metallopeptidase [Oscillospiraceae bacterium]
MIPLGAALGVPLRMHPAFPVLMATALWLGHGRALLAALFALAIHEAAHALAARACGHRLGAIELTPFGGVADLVRPSALRPGQEIIIALAGPLASLFCALAMAASGWTGMMVQHFFRVNLVLCLFNLLPALPLDGGRALRALLTHRLGRARATRLLAAVGVGLGLCIVGLGIWAATRGMINPLLFLMGPYLAYAAIKERDGLAAACAEALHGRAARLSREGALPVKLLAVRPGDGAQRLAARLTAGTYHLFVVVDGRLNQTGVVDEGQVLREAFGERVRDAVEGGNCT